MVTIKNGPRKKSHLVGRKNLEFKNTSMVRTVIYIIYDDHFFSKGLEGFLGYLKNF